jgi:hypothetical protein
VRPRKCVKQQHQPEGCETQRQQPLYPVQHLSAPLGPPAAMALLRARARSRWWWRAGRCGDCCSDTVTVGSGSPGGSGTTTAARGPLSSSRVGNLALSAPR